MNSSGEDPASRSPRHDSPPDPSTATEDTRPSRTPVNSDPPTSTPSGVLDWFRWFWNTERSDVMIVREVLVSVGIVLTIGFLLFSISGVWPPMVAIESGSMEPHMSRHDLVFITGPDRFAHDAAIEGTGVVPHDIAATEGYQKFGDYGDVIVFQPNGNGDRVPIIHRAHLWVEDGENWYDRADEEYIGSASNCNQLSNCPAPHAGFITLGDANGAYDQVDQRSEPVRPDWIIGTANVKIPYLGWIRLTLSDAGILSIEPAPGLSTTHVGY